MRRVIITVIVAVGLVAPAVAVARRVATGSTRAAIERAAIGHGEPQRCVLVYVTTKDGGNWATAALNPRCPRVAQGVGIVHRTHGSWRLVTGGSAFGCRELRQLGMPVAVRHDLRLACLPVRG